MATETSLGIADCGSQACEPVSCPKASVSTLPIGSIGSIGIIGSGTRAWKDLGILSLTRRSRRKVSMPYQRQSVFAMA